ncbi:hypothetical protein MKX03_009046 [Papaver bracteatum]|nr:hypothetical protein MKX03_009046 [Papaver bracteatum]
MFSLRMSMNVHVGMDRDILQERNQIIQPFSNLLYEENEASPTDLDSVSSPPPASVVYGGHGTLFWITFKIWFDWVFSYLRDAIVSVMVFFLFGSLFFRLLLYACIG